MRCSYKSATSTRCHGVRLGLRIVPCHDARVGNHEEHIQGHRFRDGKHHYSEQTIHDTVMINGCQLQYAKPTSQ